MARGKQTKKLNDDSASVLPWRNATPHDPIALLAGSSQGGFMCLEEVDGSFYLEFGNKTTEPLPDGNLGSEIVEIEHKTIQKRKRLSKKESSRSNSRRKLQDEESPSIKQIQKRKRQKESSSLCDVKHSSMERCNEVKIVKGSRERETPDENFKEQMFQDERMLEWAELRLDEKIMKALYTLGFLQPTAIQKACIPAAAHRGKDIIGAAETGSGKTLAFVIPIIQRLLEEEQKYRNSLDNLEEVLLSDTSNSRSFLRALILTPTRELALQVCKHFKDAAKFTTITAVPIVGGMASQKQERLLRKRPEVIVGTPGRLWELMSAGEQHLTELNYLSFMVLDEADRMIEKGHFQELQSILSLLPVVDTAKDSFKNSNALSSDLKGIHRRQTFVFSATLALPVGFRKKLKQSHLPKKQHSKHEEYSVAFLSEKAGIRSNVAIIDLTTENIVADKLEESIIQCGEEEKDLFLYYLLKLHGLGRLIIFCTSIAAVRHVAAVLGLLQVQAWPLHAQMQQRQRLKYMDRFQRKEDACLISTDVAARGLDIPGVRTVIHYQLPHSAETYVHRSGRTARASQDGCSIIFVTPSEQTKYVSLCNALSKTRLPLFPCNRAYMPAVAKRVQLAEKIDSLSRNQKKIKANKSWFQRNAMALELDLGNENIEEQNHSAKKKEFELRKLHQELKTILDQPLEPANLSHRFITGAGISPLLACQLKDYARQKPKRKQTPTIQMLGPERVKRGLLVIGEEMVEPLELLRSSRSQSLG